MTENTKMPVLTEKEAELLDFICMGFSFDEVAESLLKSKHTVSAQFYVMAEKFKGLVEAKKEKPSVKEIVKYVKDCGWRREAVEAQEEKAAFNEGPIVCVPRIHAKEEKPVAEPIEEKPVENTAVEEADSGKDLIKSSFGKKIETVLSEAGRLAISGESVEEHRNLYYRYQAVYSSAQEIEEVLT